MQHVDTYKGLPEEIKGCVVAIGNFDGIHQGHQALIAKAKQIAKEKGKSLAILTFEPHPRALFRADEPPFRITPAALKAHRLEKEGVEILCSLPFDWDFASQSAEEFVQNILVDGLAASHVIVGYNFRFGQLRKGTSETIEAAGLSVTVLDQVSDEKEGYSSSRIRTHLRHGEIEQANALLGWDWEIWGEVVRGDRRGHELGYPTANMALEDTLHPAYGVYASWACVKTDEAALWLPAATNIGIRPMYAVPTAQVETYIFDFDQEIYGQVLRVKPVARLRGEAKFDSADELIAQMEQDCAEAKELLKEP